MPVSSSASPPNKSAILAIILVSYVMIILDTSIVLTGLPAIQHDLGFSDSGLAWVQSAYTLTFGGFLLLSARAGDILGRRVRDLAIQSRTATGWRIHTSTVAVYLGRRLQAQLRPAPARHAFAGLYHQR